ncbi:hypothetical protein QYE76_070868 [Lolium multiflorum]|uniref:CCHC-type domain-containing protein n=1 Tax=Lolium multiflorum TaxID=4521 RepID=A0AAD8SK69_LOLMU|nr:hypothetical protein QYE76_070868 [Lolium multiflorum]
MQDIQQTIDVQDEFFTKEGFTYTGLLLSGLTESETYQAQYANAQVPAHGSNRENEGATNKSLLKRQGPPQDSNHGSSDASLGQDNENPWDLSMFNDMELDEVTHSRDGQEQNNQENGTMQPDNVDVDDENEEQRKDITEDDINIFLSNEKLAAEGVQQEEHSENERDTEFEPRVGMEFATRDEAQKFFNMYAYNVGFSVTYVSSYRTTNMASPINFNQFLEKEKLKSNGSNFTDWFRHVRIFLNGGNLQYVLDAPLGDPPAETETDEVKNVYATRKTRYSQVQCAILCSLESDLQKRFEHHDPHELMKELKTIFETHAAVECYEASKHFFSCMMEEGSSISEHMLVMTGHAKKLSDLGIVIPNRLGINRVLQSLPPSYKNFVMNYNMQNMNKEFPELFGMLKAAEIEIKKEHQVLMVNKTTSFKKQGKSKGKFKKGGKKAATPPMKPKNGPKPDADCYYCKEKGHWKRNCSKYLADLKSGLVKKKKEVPDVIPDITRSSGMVRRIRFIYRMSFYVNKMMRKVLWKVLEGSRKVRKKPPRKVESTWDSTSMAGQP